MANLTVQLEVAMNEDTLKGQWMQLKGITCGPEPDGELEAYVLAINAR